MGLQVGSAIEEASKIVRGALPVGEYPDGRPVSCPVVIASGTENGPVLWLQACVHGQEIGGTLALQAFLDKLALDSLKGTVVCVMVANPLAFCEGRRAALRGATDLNRVFPGKPNGTLNERVAYTLSQAAISIADAVLDFHSGGNDFDCCHHVIYAGGKESAPSASLAGSLGASRLWEVEDGNLQQAAISVYARRGSCSHCRERRRTRG